LAAEPGSEVRPYRLSRTFYSAIVQHAPEGSHANDAIADTLEALRDEAAPLPGPKDVEDLPVPWRRFYARPVKGTDLALIYELAGEVVVIHSVRLIAW
jgi:hypothetical protein